MLVQTYTRGRAAVGDTTIISPETIPVVSIPCGHVVLASGSPPQIKEHRAGARREVHYRTTAVCFLGMCKFRMLMLVTKRRHAILWKDLDQNSFFFSLTLKLPPPYRLCGEERPQRFCFCPPGASSKKGKRWRISARAQATTGKQQKQKFAGTW